MPPLVGREESYDSLRPYLPEDAKSILEKELPRIRKQIDGEIEDFAKSFGDYIKTEVTKVSQEIEKETKEAQVRLDKILVEIGAAAAGGAALGVQAKKLQDEVEAYKQKWENMGKTTRKAILTAAKATGIPIPISTD